MDSRDLERLGMSAAGARALAGDMNACLDRHPDRSDPDAQVRLWLRGRDVLPRPPESRWRFEVHRSLYDLAYESRPTDAVPAPAWAPPAGSAEETNLGRLMAGVGGGAYQEPPGWVA